MSNPTLPIGVSNVKDEWGATEMKEYQNYYFWVTGLHEELME